MKTLSNSKLKAAGIFSLLISGAFLCSFTLQQEVKKWDAPASAKSTKNPVTANAENLAEGKSLYAKHCKSCHGASGKGDGSKAANLDVSCKDFTKPEFKKQTDGEIYWKITNGRDPMPTFKTKASNEERWELVNYVRTLGKK
jgi:mono/diheme cytochrome c family protein